MKCGPNAVSAWLMNPRPDWGLPQGRVNIDIVSMADVNGFGLLHRGENVSGTRRRVCSCVSCVAWVFAQVSGTVLDSGVGAGIRDAGNRGYGILLQPFDFEWASWSPIILGPHSIALKTDRKSVRVRSDFQPEIAVRGNRSPALVDFRMDFQTVFWSDISSIELGPWSSLSWTKSLSLKCSQQMLEYFPGF